MRACVSVRETGGREATERPGKARQGKARRGEARPEAGAQCGGGREIERERDRYIERESVGEGGRESYSTV